MNLTSKMKSFFFDREPVISAMDGATLKVFSKAGAFIMRDAQRSQKPKKPGVHSPAGQPPYSHVEWQRRRDNRQRKKEGRPPIQSGSGFRGLRQIFFVYEPQRRSVIVGPISNTGGVVTRLMEFGGTSRSSRGQTSTYPPRPFMGPAMDKNLSKLPAMWRDSIDASVSATAESAG